MKFYKLRVDLHAVTSDDIVSLVSQYADVYAYCIEGGDTNPHMHVYLEMSATSQNFRLKLRGLKLSGNKDYSLKEVEDRYPIEYLAYMMKEGHFTSYNLPEDIITQVTDYNERVKEEIKEKKANKRTQLEIVTEAWRALKNKPEDLEDITQFVLSQFEGKLLREFQIVSLVQSLCYHENASIRLRDGGARVLVKFRSEYHRRLASKIL